MAVQRYTAKPYSFTWDGLRVGMRLPNVEEMIKLTAARDAYWDTITDKKQQGDQTKLTEFQFVVGSTLACDPDDAKNPWFAENRDKQRELEANKVSKDVAEDMPSSFFVAATDFFNNTITRANLSDEDRKKFDDSIAQLKKAAQEDEDADKEQGDSEAGKPEATAPTNGTPTTPTVPNSDGSQSELQSTLNAPSISSTDGVTTAS